MTSIEKMLTKYELNNEDSYKQAFKEIMQETILCGLSRSGFFKKAAFTGGTALRIFHGIERFSEDLDFSLLEPNRGFSFNEYSKYVEDELNANGFEVEMKEPSDKSAVKSAFIKADTYKLMLNFSSLDPQVFSFPKTEKIKIKLEVDTNPPNGARYEEMGKALPSPYTVRILDKPSMFALKTHAIICRNYTKGRDYYDYIWFLENDVHINERLLKEALVQTEKTDYDTNKIKDAIIQKFESTDIEEVKKDVRRFLENPDSIANWTTETFLSTINRLVFNNKYTETRKNTDDINEKIANEVRESIHKIAIKNAPSTKEAEKLERHIYKNIKNSPIENIESIDGYFKNAASTLDTPLKDVQEDEVSEEEER